MKRIIINFIERIYIKHKKALKVNLFVSYVSTNAIKPFGNAIENETIAASSPSFASAVLILKTLDKFFRWLMASSSMSAEAPVALSRLFLFRKCYGKEKQLKLDLHIPVSR